MAGKIKIYDNSENFWEKNSVGGLFTVGTALIILKKKYMGKTIVVRAYDLFDELYKTAISEGVSEKGFSYGTKREFVHNFRKRLIADPWIDVKSVKDGNKSGALYTIRVRPEE